MLKPYAFFLCFVLFILSAATSCAQNEGNALTNKTQPPSQKEVALNAAIKGLQAVMKKKDAQINGLNVAIKSLQGVVKKKDLMQAEKDKKINALNIVIKSLQTAKTDLLKAQKTGVVKDKQINGLNIAIKSLQGVVKKKDLEQAEKDKKINALNIAMKSLQDTVKKKETELVALDKELAEMDKDLASLDKMVIEGDTKLVAMKTAINCYRQALNSWDDLHRKKKLTERNLMTIAIELKRNISTCPGI